MSVDAPPQGADGPTAEARTGPGMRIHDIAVVGGGPAGLQAALKALLLFKTCILFDKGRKYSRIFFAPQVDNIPGDADGVRGQDIIKAGYAHIERMQERLDKRLVDVHEQTEVVDVTREAHDGEKRPLYVLHHRSSKAPDAEPTKAYARNLVLATGSVDRQPITQEYRRRDIETILPYANKGLADYCLLCDGHLVEGKRVAVIGCGSSAATVAASLKKNFDADTTLVTCGGLHPDHGEAPRIDDETRAFLQERKIPIIEKEVKGWFGLKERKLGIEFTDGTKERFDKGWISMGWYSVNSELAVKLGAATADEGTVRTTADCEAVDADGEPIAGLYAVGDVRHGSWNQIPIGWGEAETAVVHAFAHHL